MEGMEYYNPGFSYERLREIANQWKGAFSDGINDDEFDEWFENRKV